MEQRQTTRRYGPAIIPVNHVSGAPVVNLPLTLTLSSLSLVDKFHARTAELEELRVYRADAKQLPRERANEAAELRSWKEGDKREREEVKDLKVRLRCCWRS